MKQNTILLINPPIYDFVAYDLWAKPLGLLYIASMLRAVGCKISLIDCMDRMRSDMPTAKHGRYGCGHYAGKIINKPKILSGIPRTYHRFGLPVEAMRKALFSVQAPRAILVTSAMTYWYAGVVEAIKLARECFPNTPIILGGTYATLCTDHAIATSGALRVVAGHNPFHIFSALKELGICLSDTSAPSTFAQYPMPAYDLYPTLPYAAIRTSTGCPFSCTYCAISQLSSGYCRKPPETSAREIQELANRGVKDIAFYDDALLYQAQGNIIPLLQYVARCNLNVRFHTPNGLHSCYLSKETAIAMYKANFVMPRLSLETANEHIQKRTGGKVSREQFENGVANLKSAGYHAGQYGAYIMMGMPNQELNDVEATICYAHALGAHISLAEYSPIPGTTDWLNIKNKLPSDDPLWHNNSIFPLRPLSDWPKIQKLKGLARELNKCFT